MGQQTSKDELLYQQVNSGNSQGIKALRNEGAGLEWVDNEGKTPLIVACMNLELYNVAKTLIELGANVNAYRPGHYAGTPLHHAAKRGLEQTVKLLLSHGANALVMNDDCQTPIDVARAKGYTTIVRAIEGQVCLFSGWLRELHGPGFLELLAPQLLSRKVWVVVLPCGSRNSKKPFKLELAIYSGTQDAQPRTIVLLWKANLMEPNFNHPDPTAIVSDISRIHRRWKRKRGIKSSQEARRSRIKLVPLHQSEIQQLQQFCNACKGIPQVLHPLFPFNNQPPPTAPAAPPTATEDEESESDASRSSASSSTSTSSYKKSNNNKASTSQEAPAQHFQSHNTVPLVIQIENPAIDNGPIHYPSIDMIPAISSTNVEVVPISGDDDKEYGGDSSSCTICLDAPLEGACVPCGHMAGCMTCLNEIKVKKWGCPMCRAKIDQVIRIYAV